ncbi:hypothetical protein SAMN05421749_102237 [Acinetobacter marinus]|uniref:Uncharacterized protein n=1 Tax=Acinetobacter marinus TaxID=281375 RepID=A0A1G6HGN8_9GAMM|nr:hypothetical protein SAMN05421749_102237 [Acinetobacter marinus]
MYIYLFFNHLSHVQTLKQVSLFDGTLSYFDEEFSTGSHSIKVQYFNPVSP